MADKLTGEALAERIESIVTWRPDLHDQEFWFSNYDENNKRSNEGGISPEDMPLQEIIREATEMLEEEVPCNTTLCIAGWALILNGYEIRRDKIPSRFIESIMVPDDYTIKDGHRYDIYKKAGELLGISQDDADKLFSDSLSNDQAVDALGFLANGNPIEWGDVVGDDEQAYYEEPYDRYY